MTEHDSWNADAYVSTFVTVWSKVTVRPQIIEGTSCNIFEFV
jgi:hypothetical protein